MYKSGNRKSSLSYKVTNIISLERKSMKEMLLSHTHLLTCHQSTKKCEGYIKQVFWTKNPLFIQVIKKKI